MWYLCGRSTRISIRSSFFLIYINDISDNLISLCRLFADDTSFGYSETNADVIKQTISHDLSELSNWSKLWLMSFNPNKTEIMVFSNCDIHDDFIFTLDDQNIPIVKKHKHLGITLSDDAKWNDHVDSLLQSISKHVSVLRKLQYKINRNNLEKLYLVYIRPLFEYGCEIWDNCGVIYTEKLEKLQREALRIITGLPYYCSNERLYSETCI